MGSGQNQFSSFSLPYASSSQSREVFLSAGWLHVLQSLVSASNEGRLFDSTVVLVSVEGPCSFLSLEVVSRRRSWKKKKMVEEAITCE